MPKPSSYRLHDHSPDLSPARPLPWMDDAACTGTNPAIWFPKAGDWRTTEKARAICRWCPVAADCWAFAQETDYGRSPGSVMAGMDGRERFRAYTAMRASEREAE